MNRRWLRLNCAKGASFFFFCECVGFSFWIHKYSQIISVMYMDADHRTCFWVIAIHVKPRWWTAQPQQRHRHHLRMIFTIRVAKRGCGTGWEEEIKMFRRRSWHLGCHIWNLLDVWVVCASVKALKWNLNYSWLVSSLGDFCITSNRCQSGIGKKKKKVTSGEKLTSTFSTTKNNKS